MSFSSLKGIVPHDDSPLGFAQLLAELERR
jgi:hypothetical protein